MTAPGSAWTSANFAALLLLVLTACAAPDETADRVESPDAAPWFAEVQETAGLDFKHVHGGSGERYMIETMTGGAGLADFDNDGWLDAYLVQSGPLPGYADPTPLPNRLYRNRGLGVGELAFEDVTEGSGAGDTGYGIGTCFGDVDNDGWTDIYVTNLGQDVLLRNLGQADAGRVRFEDITEASGIDSPRYGSSCAFADYDQDGCLDLFVVNFVDFALDNHRLCGAAELRTYCSPDVYNGLPDQLYRNRCDGSGSFEDVSEHAGIANHDPEQGKGLGVVWTDFDTDGDADVYVANDSTRNFLYRNNGDGTFEDVAIFAGAAFNDRGVTEASMGLDAGDYDGDGLLDLFMTHLDFESNTLYRNVGNDLFLDSSTVTGIAAPSATRVGFGTNFLDFDHDGDLDLFVANGHIIDNIALRNQTLEYEQTNQLYENVGGRFVDVSQRAGEHFSLKRVGRATATGDLDNDGDLDLLIANSDREAVVLANRRELQRDDRHWLMLRLLSRHGSRDAIGARVEIHAGDRIWVDEIHSGASYLSQSDLRLHFGLGEVAAIDRLRIRWPEGEIQEIDGSEIAVDRLHEILQAPSAQ